MFLFIALELDFTDSSDDDDSVADEIFEPSSDELSEELDESNDRAIKGKVFIKVPCLTVLFASL